MAQWYRTPAAQGERPPEDWIALPYLRVSSKKQDRGFSPEAQRNEITAYVRRQGWTLGAEYRDTLQGWRSDRPGWVAMKAQVRTLRAQGVPCVVVAVAVDRAGRDEAELHTAHREMDDLGVAMHFTRENGVVDGVTFSAKGMVAKIETENIRKRVRASKVTVREKGLPPAGPAAWGYTWRLPVDEDEATAMGVNARFVRRVLDVDDACAPSVRELFARVAGGASVSSLLSWVGGLPYAARGARALGRTPIRQVLRSPLYVRRQVAPGMVLTPAQVLDLPKGKWPALVADDVWLAVQESLDAHRTPGRPSSGNYLLSGYLRCAVCGARMNGDANRDKDGVLSEGKRRYRCTSRTKGGALAARRCIATANGAKSEAAVLSWVGAVVARVRDMEQRDGWAAVVAALDAQDAQATPDADVLAALDQTITRLRETRRLRRERLYDAVDQDERDDLAETIRRLNAEITQREQERAKLDAGAQDAVALDDGDLELIRIGGFTYSVDTTFGRDTDDRRALLKALVQSCTVVPTQTGRGRRGDYRAHVEWTPLGKRLATLATVG